MQDNDLFWSEEDNDVLDYDVDLPYLPENMHKLSAHRIKNHENYQDDSITATSLSEYESEASDSLYVEAPDRLSPERDTYYDGEAYVEEDGSFSSERKYIILIIYDIITNKQRVKMAKLLSGYGSRVQKSAFEARLTKKQYARLLHDIKKMLKADDNVRIYKLRSYDEIKTFGDKKYEILEDVIII